MAVVGPWASARGPPPGGDGWGNDLCGGRGGSCRTVHHLLRCFRFRLGLTCARSGSGLRPPRWLGGSWACSRSVARVASFVAAAAVHLSRFRRRRCFRFRFRFRAAPEVDWRAVAVAGAAGRRSRLLKKKERKIKLVLICNLLLM